MYKLITIIGILITTLIISCQKNQVNKNIINTTNTNYKTMSSALSVWDMHNMIVEAYDSKHNFIRGCQNLSDMSIIINEVNDITDSLFGFSVNTSTIIDRQIQLGIFNRDNTLKSYENINSIILSYESNTDLRAAMSKISSSTEIGIDFINHSTDLMNSLSLTGSDLIRRDGYTSILNGSYQLNTTVYQPMMGTAKDNQDAQRRINENDAKGYSTGYLGALNGGEDFTEAGREALEVSSVYSIIQMEEERRLGNL